MSNEFLCATRTSSRNFCIWAIERRLKMKKLIAREWLDFKGLSVRKLAELIPNGDPGYRTVDEFIRRGGGTLFTGAAISDALGLELTDIYIDENMDAVQFIENHPKGGNARGQPPPKHEALVPPRNIDSAVSRAQTFAASGDGKANRAAGDFAQALRLTRFTFNGDFEALSRTFLRARDSDINQLEPEQIADYIRRCKDNDADDDVEHMAFTLMNPRFDVTPEAYSQFAVCIGEVGYEKISADMFAWGKKHFGTNA